MAYVPLSNSVETEYKHIHVHVQVFPTYSLPTLMHVLYMYM